MSKPYETDNKLPNIIGGGTKVVGDIETNGDLRIDGAIEGNIKSQGKLVLGQAGTIKGTVHCASAELAGTFEGSIEVADLLSLKSTANYKGEMKVNKLSIEPGAKFNGQCTMTDGKTTSVSGVASEVKK